MILQSLLNRDRNNNYNKLFFSALIFIIIVNVLSCKVNIKEKADYPVLVTKYYKSKINSKGYYKYNHPVGTFLDYDTAGNINIIKTYDSSGKLNGKFISFNSNGDTDQIGNYKDGKLNGLITSFIKNRVSEKAFFLNDSQIGNTYLYDINSGKVALYNFLNFNSDCVKIINYNKDSVSNNQIIFIDSILSYLQLRDKERLIKLAILISIPPGSTVLMKIQQVDKLNSVKYEELFSAKNEYYIYNYKLTKDIVELKLIGTELSTQGHKETLIKIINL